MCIGKRPAPFYIGRPEVKVVNTKTDSDHCFKGKWQKHPLFLSFAITRRKTLVFVIARLWVKAESVDHALPGE